MMLPEVVSIVAVPHPINAKPPTIVRVGLGLLLATPDRKRPAMSVR